MKRVVRHGIWIDMLRGGQVRANGAGRGGAGGGYGGGGAGGAGRASPSTSRSTSALTCTHAHARALSIPMSAGLSPSKRALQHAMADAPTAWGPAMSRSASRMSTQSDPTPRLNPTPGRV